MYRDDPLDDEMELREIAGDDAVDAILAGGGPDLIGIALDVLRILQGWVDDESAGAWFSAPQRRLDRRTPVDALRDGDIDEVLDAARHWAAAQG